MKTKNALKLLAPAALFCATFALMLGNAEARVGFSIGVGLPLYGAAPVYPAYAYPVAYPYAYPYYAPPAYAPAPATYAPPPAAYAPPPPVYAPPGYYGAPYVR